MGVNEAQRANRSWVFPAAIIGTVALAAGSALGAAVPVDNSSFESPDMDQTNDTFQEMDAGDLPNWTLESSGGNDIFIQDEAATTNQPDPPDGDQWLVANNAESNPANGRVHQNIGTVQQGSRYTLEATLGSRSDIALPPDFFIGLWADTEADPSIPENLLAEKTKSDVTLADTSIDTTAVTVTFDAGATFDGQNLFARLGIPASAPGSGDDGTRQILYDDVSVTEGVIPEPASLALLAPAGLLMLRRRRAA